MLAIVVAATALVAAVAWGYRRSRATAGVPLTGVAPKPAIVPVPAAPEQRTAGAAEGAAAAGPARIDLAAGKSAAGSPVTVDRGAAARPAAAGSTVAAATAAGATIDPAQVDAARVAPVNRAVTHRLWVLAFAAPSQSQASAAVDARVRANVNAVLQLDTLDPKYFPRRPALMPQLMQVVNDPQAASEKISRIIAHDPVLTVDVLRLANSSLYRTSTTPIETIQRAIVVCGVDALRGMLATAMLSPVFRATRKNFPRLPRLLWERTERATRAAELYALATHPADRFEAQLVVLMGALGPLVVYSAALDVYARNPHFHPNGDLCVELIGELASLVSRHIAREWESSPRLLAALEDSAAEPLTAARETGELLGTLSFLEFQNVITPDQRLEFLDQAGIPAALSNIMGEGLTGKRD